MLINDYRSKALGLPDLVPYAALISPGIILNKDGSFLAGWRFTGQDTASSTENELAWVSQKISAGLQLLGSGWMLHVDAIRKPHFAYPPEHSGFFPDPVTRLIDDERRSFFGRGLCYKTETVVIATYSPDTTAIKMGQAVSDGAVVSDMEKYLAIFQSSLEDIEDSLSSVLLLERLEEYEVDGVLFSDLLSHLQGCLTGDFHPIRVPDTPMYLDAILGGVDLIGGLQPRLGDRYLSVVAIDGLPHESWPSMLASLDSLPIPYRYSTRFICLDQLDGIKEVNSYRKGWQQQMFRFIDMFMNNPNARMNRDAQMMRDDAEEALIEVQSGSVGVGYVTSCVVLLANDEEELQGCSRELKRILQTLGFGCRIETINSLEAWLGTHPGNSYANIRRPLINTLNLADLLPLATIWPGNKYAPCPFYPPRSRPLAVVTTDGNTPFWLNLHSGDLGHTLVFGPTGSGKSTCLALISAQFRGYKDAHITAFDKGNSLFPLCLGAGGDHYNIGVDDLSFAPLQNIEFEDDFKWAKKWIESLVELQKITLLPSHKNDIHQALATLRHNPKSMRSMTDFWHVVQNVQIKEALLHYTKQGTMGSLLDAKQDNLSISAFSVFEIETLMEMGEENLLPVLLYLFRQFEKSLKGQPSILLLDEAWVMLGNEVFRAKIREWLKVLRKANCAVVLATQSLSDAKGSGILDVLAESCPTKIFLANTSAQDENQYDLYSGLGLNDRQIAIIGTATQKRDYYVVSPEGRRLIQLALGPKTLAFVGSSDKASLARIKNLQNEYGPEWPQVWLKEKGIEN